jgi:hypothetical protein
MSFFASWLKNGFWRQITILLPPTWCSGAAQAKQQQQQQQQKQKRHL